MTERNRELGSRQLEPGKKKSADFGREDGFLNTRLSAEERSCWEGV